MTCLEAAFFFRFFSTEGDPSDPSLPNAYSGCDSNNWNINHKVELEMTCTNPPRKNLKEF